MGYVFVSYDRADPSYVGRLRDHLRSSGLDVWVDDHNLSMGTRLELTIRDAIDQCAAVVVVMTPGAEESDWVGNEVQRAKIKKKPIIPLLHSGEQFFNLQTTLYEDVRDGSMPSARSIEPLLRACAEPTVSSTGRVIDVDTADAAVEVATVVDDHGAEEVKPPSILICHAQADLPDADDLRVKLISAGFDVWVDHEDLAGGEMWEREIEAAIRSVDYVVVVQSEHLRRLTEGYVNSEINLALDRQRFYNRDARFIIPVVIDDEANILDSLSHFQAVRLFEPDGFDRLVETIRRDVERTAKL